MGVNGEQIHLIGHSLGAHIVGSAGRYYANQTGDLIGRITGLDPARPCFVGNPAYPRIARGDAIFVDIIHSNPGDLGTEENIADADFYAGGLDVTKPGCSSISIICSHIIGVYYYIESVYPNNEYDFVGQKCGNFSDLEAKNCTRTSAPMGFAASSSFEGIYYVDVRDQSPYGTNATSSPFVEYEKCGMCPQ